MLPYRLENRRECMRELRKRVENKEKGIEGWRRVLGLRKGC